MATEDEQIPWISLIFKILAVVILTLIPIMCLFTLLLLIPWIPYSWVAPTLLLSGLVFLVGANILLIKKNPRFWVYTLLLGFGVGFASIAVVTLHMLSFIQVPIVGNAAFLVLISLTMIGFLINGIRLKHTESLHSGVVTTSSKVSSSQSKTSLSLMFQRRRDKVLAVELEEIPHDYALGDEANFDISMLIEKLQTVVRSASSIPWTFQIQRKKWRTRVLFLTWSQDDTLLEHQLSILSDALNNNLPGFKFKSIGSPTAQSLRDEDNGAAVLINGVPLSIDDERERKDPLDPVIGVIQSLENGLFQVTMEPARVSESKTKALEAQHARADKRSETTFTKESSSIIFGQQQESQTVVDLRSKREAERLSREIERLKVQQKCRTTVAVASWGRDLTEADLTARRIAASLVGAIRPDNKHDEFQIEYKRKQKDISRLLTGLPIGKSTIMSIEEATAYCVLPKILEIKVTKRERFSTGTNVTFESEEGHVEESTDSSSLPDMQRIVSSAEFILGNTIDETGKVNPHSYVTMGVQGINMHVGVWGSTRMGKTTLIMSLVGQSISKGINPILMVPSKGFEYDMLMHLFPDIRVFTCGRADVANLVYNPWDPPDGVRLTKWVDRVVEVWTLWMPNERVISMHVDDVVYKVYEICNWDLEENKKGRPILLEDVVAAVNIVCESLPYGDEVNSNIKGALISRIKSILRKPSLAKMFNTRTGLTISELMAHPTIIRMDDLSENDKILVMGLLTAAVSEYKLANPSTQVTNILVLEEAHYLLGRSDLTGEANSAVRLQAVNALIEMLRVLGGTGLGVILVDQLPSELVPKAVKIPVNTVVFALTHEEDKELAGKRARCTDSQIDHISGMKVGEAVVFLQREGAPQNVMILPLDKLIGNEQPVDLTGDQAIRNHMQPIFDQYPELHSSEPLPDGLLNQLLTRKTDSSKQWFERISLEFRRQIEGTVQSRKFKEYCKKLIAKEDISALMKLIQKTSDVSGDGSYISSLYVLDQMVKCYRNPENQPVFDKMGLEVDEAKPT